MNRVWLKHQAKDTISNTKPHPLVTSAIYILLLLLISMLISNIIGSHVQNDTLNSIGKIFGKYSTAAQNPDFFDSPEFNFMLDELEDSYDELMGQFKSFLTSPLSVTLYLALLLMNFMINIGFTIFSLNVASGRESSPWNLLDGFGVFLRAVWLSILMTVFISLWTCLFVIPGIIAIYRYRMAIYLMLENPGLSAYECIRESSSMMKGHKWELFVIDLSFILWDLASSLPVLGYAVRILYEPFRAVTNALFYRQRYAETHQSPNPEPQI